MINVCAPSSCYFTFRVKKYYWITNPPDLLTTVYYAKIDGVHLPRSEIQFSDAFATNISCPDMELRIYNKGTTTAHQNLEVFKNITTNTY